MKRTTPIVFFLLLFVLNAWSVQQNDPDFTVLQEEGSVTFIAQVTGLEESLTKYGKAIKISLLSQNQQEYAILSWEGQLVAGMVSILNVEEVTACLQKFYPRYPIFPNLPLFEEKNCYEITLEKKQILPCTVVLAGIGIEGTGSEDVVLYAGRLRVKNTQDNYQFFDFSSLTSKEITCTF